MLLGFTRFVFGFALAWMSAGVLIAATLAYLRLAGIGVLLFAHERAQHATAMGLLVAIVAAALSAAYFLARGLENALGHWVLGIETADWLAEPDTLSASVVIGALMGITLLIAVVARVLRPAKTPEQLAAEQADRDRAKARSDALKAAEQKALEKKNADARKKTVTKAAQAKKATAANKKVVKPPRRAALGTFGLFFLLAGAAIGVFAFTVDPLWPAQDASELAMRFHMERASRAKYVYATAAGLLALGTALSVLWLVWRRRA